MFSRNQNNQHVDKQSKNSSWCPLSGSTDWYLILWWHWRLLGYMEERMLLEQRSWKREERSSLVRELQEWRSNVVLLFRIVLTWQWRRRGKNIYKEEKLWSWRRRRIWRRRGKGVCSSGGGEVLCPSFVFRAEWVDGCTQTVTKVFFKGNRWAWLGQQVRKPARTQEQRN